MMKPNRRFRLSFATLFIFLATVVCSSGYITPGSMAATAAADKSPPTAFYVAPSATARPASSPTTTVEPSSTPLVLPSATPEDSPTPGPPILYSAQAGDYLKVVAVHFGVDPSEILSPNDIPSGLINPGQLLIIPNRLGEVSPNERLVPDSDVIYSPSAIGFNAKSYGAQAGGYLSSYREYLTSSWHNGGAVIEKAALEHSINPRLLLSILQYQSGWVLGQPADKQSETYPLGYIDDRAEGLYSQIVWAVKQLSTGYYGWREGLLTELTFSDGRRLRIAPDLNAGTVAVQYLFSQLYDYETWLKVMDKDSGFAALHASMFPDPWVRAAQEEPLFPTGLSQPQLSLPFYKSQVWSFTSGPHGAWDRWGAMAALDFAPSSSEPGCVPSTQWITAAAAGLVVRTGKGVVVLDLDGDGNEQTGWAILYLHILHEERVPVGTWVDQGTLLGFPSCEGGFSTATHVHIARKYNGEWVSAAGPIPFNLSGWLVQDGGAPYKGTMTRDGETLTACTCGNPDTLIARSSSDPY